MKIGVDDGCKLLGFLVAVLGLSLLIPPSYRAGIALFVLGVGFAGLTATIEILLTGFHETLGWKDPEDVE